MTIIGRITKDAVTNHLKDDRTVVNFSIALNDYYKPKGQEKGVTYTTYINCSYWLSPKAAERLKKGTLVELSGRIGVNAYNDMEGNAKATLTFHVNSFTVHQTAKGKAAAALASTEKSTDLPF